MFAGLCQMVPRKGVRGGKGCRGSPSRSRRR